MSAALSPTDRQISLPYPEAPGEMWQSERNAVSNHADKVDHLLGRRQRCDLLCATVALMCIICGVAQARPAGGEEAFIREYTFDRSRFGTTSLPFWYELTDFERMALEGKAAAKAGDPQALFALAIMASGNERSMEAWETFRGQLETFVRRIKPNVERAVGPENKGRVVFDEMCRTFYEEGSENEGTLGYDRDQSQLTELLRSKRYNCVSSTLLYLVCARYFALNVKAIDIPEHAFVELETDSGHTIYVETTNRGGYGLVHDEDYYKTQTKLKQEKGQVTRVTYADFLNRRLHDPYGLIALNMQNQHTSEARMSVVDRNRVREVSGYLYDTDRDCVKARLIVYSNEFSHFSNTKDTLNMGRMFSRVGALLQDVKRSWMRDTALTPHIADFLRDQYKAGLLCGRDSQALVLLPDAVELLKTGDTSYVSMMNAIDVSTSNYIIRNVEAKQFERAIAYLDSYAPFMRPGNKLTNSRSYILDSWAYAFWEEKKWDQSVAQYTKALAAARDTAMAGRVRGNLVLAYLRWADALRGTQAWQQAVERCSTAQSYALSDESMRPIHEKAVRVHVDWCNTLVKAAAWDAALEKLSRAEHYASTAALKSDLASARVAVHESWASSFWERKEWEPAAAQYVRALAGATDTTSVRRIYDNMASAYLSWSVDLWDRGAWQQVVEKCSTANVCARSDEQKLAARKNLVNAYINWSRQFADSGAWSDALDRIDRAVPYAVSAENRRSLADARVYVRESWAEANWGQKRWDEAVAQLHHALSAAGDAAEAKRIKDNIAGVYTLWLKDLWTANAWQQVVEKCSTAQAWAQTEERKQTSHQNMVAAYLNWGNTLSDSGAWEDALVKFQLAERLTGEGERASKCIGGIVYAYSSWGRDLFKQKRWQEAAERFLLGLGRANTEELRKPLRDNIRAACINWSHSPGADNEIEARKKILQQCVDQCADCTWCNEELERLLGQ
jgi:tetratricopeptide (TPR) repeat protein